MRDEGLELGGMPSSTFLSWLECVQLLDQPDSDNTFCMKTGVLILHSYLFLAELFRFQV